MKVGAEMFIGDHDQARLVVPYDKDQLSNEYFGL